MGDVVEFDPNRYSELEMFFRRYRAFVEKHGEPKSLYVVNDKRMEEMNRAAGYIRQIVEGSTSDIDLDIGIDEDVRTMGYIDMRTEYLPLNKDEMNLLHKAEDLADAADVCATNDDRISYELAFHNVMIRKTQMKPN